MLEQPGALEANGNTDGGCVDNPVIPEADTTTCPTGAVPVDFWLTVGGIVLIVVIVVVGLIVIIVSMICCIKKRCCRTRVEPW